MPAPFVVLKLENGLSAVNVKCVTSNSKENLIRGLVVQVSVNNKISNGTVVEVFEWKSEALSYIKTLEGKPSGEEDSAESFPVKRKRNGGLREISNEGAKPSSKRIKESFLDSAGNNNNIKGVQQRKSERIAALHLSKEYRHDRVTGVQQRKRSKWIAALHLPKKYHHDRVTAEEKIEVPGDDLYDSQDEANQVTDYPVETAVWPDADEIERMSDYGITT